MKLSFFVLLLSLLIEPKETTTYNFTVKDVTFNMVFVQSGTFNMGSSDGFKCEKPVHSVTLDSFYIGETEVTQQLWEAVMSNNPSKNLMAQNPVERVSWNDCQEFISKLNSLTGKKFRLPTEAEFEYAARGGNQSNGYQYAGSDDPEKVAWCSLNSEDKTHAVKTKMPNELGLYDISGNVTEWCQDWYGPYSVDSVAGPVKGTKRVCRGGSYSLTVDCRVSARNWAVPSNKASFLGLRLAMDAQ